MNSEHRQQYSFAEMRRDVSQDIDAYLRFASEYNQGSRNWRRLASAFFVPSVMVCWLYRFSHLCYCCGLRRSAMFIALFNQFVTGTSISPASVIGGGLYVPHPASGVTFHGIAGDGLKLFAGSAVVAGPMTPMHSYSLTSCASLGDNVALGSKALIYGPAQIGSNTRIGFNAVVFQEDIPSDAIVVSKRVRNRLVKR